MQFLFKLALPIIIEHKYVILVTDISSYQLSMYIFVGRYYVILQFCDFNYLVSDLNIRCKLLIMIRTILFKVINMFHIFALRVI